MVGTIIYLSMGTIQGLENQSLLQRLNSFPGGGAVFLKFLNNFMTLCHSAGHIGEGTKFYIDQFSFCDC